MDLLYTISRKYNGKTQFYNDFMNIEDEVKGLIRISHTNIVAWVTKYELNDTANLSLGSRVYVADLNVPWNYHKIITNDSMVTLLEWDLFGENLLIGDDSGIVTIWTYNDYIFNDWSCVGSINLQGEYMIAGIFFHSGRKMALNADKRDSIHYYEKFNYVRYAPTVQMPGGTAMDGCLVVTSTGLVVSVTLPGDTNSPLAIVTESISPVRYKISVVDVAYGKNGNLIIATSCGSYKMPIKCYEISIKFTNPKSYSIVSQPLAGFFLDNSALESAGQNWCISHLKFLVKDVVDSLIVVVNSKSGSVIQIWDFAENSCHMSHMFNETALSSDVFKTLNWKCLGSYPHDSPVFSVSTPKMLMSNAANAPCHIMVAFKNNKICALSRSLKEELCYNLDTYWDTKDVKRALSNICIGDIDISWLGNILLVSDNVGNLYVIQVRNAELDGPLTVSHATTMLEYCLVSGLDFWDLAICLKPHILEAVCERFNDNFSKQYPAVQQLEYGGFLSVKAFLYRLVGNSSQKHSDLMSLLTLHSILIAFKSLIRPLDFSSTDKVPGDTLTAMLPEMLACDMNTVMTKIDVKEFSVDPIMALSLQQLIHWVLHLALNILARVPENHKTTGYNIVNDNHALNILRELLVIIRTWAFMRPTILPAFVRSGNFDGIPNMFRLVSRLVQCNQNNEVDDNFIDECYLLQNQVLFPTLTVSTIEICDVASPAFHRQSLPVQFTFGVEPETIVYEMETFTMDGSVQATQNTDVVRHVYLGDGNPYKVKQCNRCQGKTQVVNANKSTAIRSWENRWIRSCLCGGKWRFIKPNVSPYSRKL